MIRMKLLSVNTPHDPNEVALSDGRSCLVEDKPYWEYLSNVKDDAEVRLVVSRTVPGILDYIAGSSCQLVLALKLVTLCANLVTRV
jgi:hypothetical protein